MKKYHISWLIGKDEQGLDLSTGITVEANNMIESHINWHLQHNDCSDELMAAFIRVKQLLQIEKPIVEPLYNTVK